MWHFALKDYQRESLGLLKDYAVAVRAAAMRGDGRPEHDAFTEITGRDYLTTPGFAGVPYVCLRIPTGGGKTLLAAHAVGAIGRGLLADIRETFRVCGRLILMMLAGAAIGKSAAADYCRHERTGAIRSIRSAIHHWPSLMLSLYFKKSLNSLS